MEIALHRFVSNVSKFGSRPCFLVKDGGRWSELTWRDVLGRVARLAGGLKNLGVARGDSVAIYSKTRYEWTIADLAAMSIGAVTVPIYNNLSLDQVEYILKHSGTKVLFVENVPLLEPLKTMQNNLPALEKIVLIEGEGDGEIISFADASSEPVEYPAEFLKNIIKDIKGDDVATCVYTSGTTGEVKGAELTHANIIGEVDGLAGMLSFGHDEIGLLFLPLAHVIARAMQFYQVSNGFIAAYAESIDSLAENMLEVRPHFMVVVPRVMEKVYERIVSSVENSSALKKRLFRSGVSVGMEMSRLARQHKRPPFLMDLKNRLAEKLVFSRIKGAFGGRLRLIVSGGAPLSREIGEFFHAAGLLILEGYGLTETMAAVTVNSAEDFKFGTVGKPLPGVKIRISGDGEVLLQGPQVFKGYRKPVAGIDGEGFEGGWFRTGDLGEFSRDGFLRLTGRKKELIVTAAGKNVAPVRVESALKSSPYIQDACVYGDGRKYLCALVTLNRDLVEKFAARSGVEFSTTAELFGDSKTYELIKSEIECKNRLLARHETVKKFAIIDHDFSTEAGELTPTLKVRRHKVYEKYRDLIEGMYK